MSNVNAKTISRYEKHRLEGEGLKASTVEIQMYYLKMFAKSLGNKTFKNVTEADIIDFRKNFKKSTQNTILRILRRFYRWHFELDNDDRLPRFIRNIQMVRNKKDDISYRERVITEDEYQRMLDNTYRIEHKAIIETLYIYGVRVSELLSMRATDGSDDGEFTRIIIRESKTKTREIPYNGRPKHLMAWFKSYQPFKGQKDNPLWVNTFSKSNKVFTRGGVLQLVDRARKRAGIERKISLHDFRHTSISRDRGNGVPITHIETKHGLVHGTLVMSTYDHNKAEDYEKFLREKYEERPETYETLERKRDEISELKKQLDEVRSTLKKAIDINQHPENYWTEEQHKDYQIIIEEKDRIIKEKTTAQEFEERAKKTIEEIKKEWQQFLQDIEEAKRTGENVLNKPIQQPKIQQEHEDKSDEH